MPNQNASQGDAKPSATNDYHQFTVGSRLEISQLLHAIMRQGALVTASVGDDDFFATTIVAIDEEEEYLLLEYSGDNEQAQRVLKAQRLPCDTSLDKVKIQFVCAQIEADEYNGGAAFKTALPRELMRLQRREYFRISIPGTAPVKCTLSGVDGRAPAAVQLSLRDISCGGLSVLTLPDTFQPELGTHYACTIHLPGVPALRTRVKACNAFTVKLANGKLTQRSGFAFVSLPESMLSAIQRYIMSIERQRRQHAESAA
jgi:flagellar brake protein